jgi:transposase-like protein
METQFKNLVELQEHFNNENKCWDYLENLRWKDKVVCPFCKSERYYKFKNSRTYKCKDCKKKYNAKIGTIFENTKVPLSKWFVSIYLATSHKKGISSCQLAKDIGVTQKTAWFILHRIREMLTQKAPYMLNSMVEIDECYLNPKPENKHKNKRVNRIPYGNRIKILGILQRDGIVYTELVDYVDARMLIPIITKCVDKSSTMVTDAFGSYQSLGKSYKHIVVNHLRGEYVKGIYHTNTIEGYWGLMRRGVIGTYHHLSRQHIWRYLAEFEFRYNTRKSKEIERFDYSFLNCERRLKYNELIGKFK